MAPTTGHGKTLLKVSGALLFAGMIAALICWIVAAVGLMELRPLHWQMLVVVFGIPSLLAFAAGILLGAWRNRVEEAG